MKIAITGATGFVGRHVRNALAKTDHEVVLVVRKIEKAGEITARETIVTANLNQERTDWFEIFGKPDVVLHLAWGGLPNYMDAYHVEVELPIQSKFLKALIESGLKKLVVTGTCYEYGMSSGALSEDHETNPNTPYGIAKDKLRKELFEFQQSKNFELTWARIFYPYGEGQSEKSLYSSMKSAAKLNSSEFYLSNGDSALDFISVIELSKLLKLLLIHFGNVGLINLGSGFPRLISDFAREQADLNGWNLNCISKPRLTRTYESKQFWSNNSKLNYLMSEI